MQLKPPSEGDNLNDLARFKKGLRDQFGLGNVSVDSIWIRNMPSVLREQDWLVTATVVDTTYGYKVINLQAGRSLGQRTTRWCWTSAPPPSGVSCWTCATARWWLRPPTTTARSGSAKT